MLGAFVIWPIAFLIGLIWWQRAIPLFLLWTLIEGAVRKWLLPGWQQPILFTGHAMLLGAYLRYYGRRIIKRDAFYTHHAVTIVIVFYFIFALIQAFNPDLPTPLMGIIALFVHFIFVPMAYMVPVTFGSVRRFVDFISKYIYSVLPLFVLATIQFNSPRLSLINKMLYEERPAHLAGSLGYIRVPATFTNTGGFAQQLFAMTLFVLFLISLKRLAHQRWALVLVLIATLIGVLMTATRHGIYPAYASVLVFTVIVSFASEYHRRSFWPMILITIVLLGGILIGTEVGGRAWETAFFRATAMGDTSERFADPLTPWRLLPFTEFGGHGLGLTYGGSRSLIMDPATIFTYTISSSLRVHYESERMLYELGPAGFMLVYLVRFLFLGMGIRLFIRSEQHEHRFLALIAIMFILPGTLLLQQVTYDHMASRWWWFMIGVLLLIDHEQRKSYQNKGFVGDIL